MVRRFGRLAEVRPGLLRMISLPLIARSCEMAESEVKEEMPSRVRSCRIVLHPASSLKDMVVESKKYESRVQKMARMGAYERSCDTLDARGRERGREGERGREVERERGRERERSRERERERESMRADAARDSMCRKGTAYFASGQVAARQGVPREQQAQGLRTATSPAWWPNESRGSAAAAGVVQVCGKEMAAKEQRAAAANAKSETGGDE
jgi:hypothetical protein